jgi:PEP-CTERM motif
MKALALGILASLAIAGSAAAARFDIHSFGDYYGPYSGIVLSPGSFTWRTAGYFWSGNIDLTEGGDVIADIVTNYDTYTLYTADAAVGAPCTASACIAVTDGETVSLYNTISDLNGGYGICCDFNGVSPEITVNPTPEASTWAMMVLGVGAMGVALRRRRAGALLPV